MSLTFVDRGKGLGEFTSGCITVDVSNAFNDHDGGETAEMQSEKVRRLLAGERGLRPMYSNCNGESELTISADGVFSLQGGQYGPAFGDTVSIKASYADNKVAIDEFMAFLLKADGKEEEGESD